MKKFIMMLLALALVCSFMVAAPAASAEEATHSHCVCVKSSAKPEGHVCDETVVWEPYVKGMTLVDGGHYYLTADVGETRNLTSSTNKLNITICLNGHTFRAQTPFKVQNGNTLTICDCQGTGAIRSSQTKGTGYSVWAGYNGGVVNLYSGILSGMISSGVYARPVVVEGGTFNMYGGVIKNGDSGTITTGSPNLGYGGNVLVKNYVGSKTHVGTFNMYGGSVEGGKASADGGNFYVLAGVLNISGGTVKNGSAVNGGNIAANGDGRKVDLTISGGIVEKGVATGNGGNIYMLNTTNGTVLSVKENAQILDGSAVNGGNIYQDKGNPSTISGGIISGGAASENGGNIYLTKDMTINGGEIKNGTAGKGVTEKTDAQTGEVATVTTYTGNGGNLYISENSIATISGGSFVGGHAKNGGSIYAMNDLTLSNVSVFGGYATGNGGNILINKKVLTLNGATVSGGSANQGGNIAVTNIGAQLIATDAKIENGTVTNSGGNIYTLNVPTVTISGGEITGGTAANHGGNLYITHTETIKTRRLTMSGVTVSGGSAEKNGGNLYIAKTGVVTLTDLICENGLSKVSGSNVYMEGNYDVTFSGGTYSLPEGGRKYTTNSEDADYLALVAQYGLNVASADLVSAGGTRLDGNGGNICIAWGNDIVTKDDEGNVTATAENSTKLNGTTILGGNAVNGGCLYIGNANATINNLTAKSCGGEAGRVLHIAKNGVVDMTNSTLVNWGVKGTTIYNNGTLRLIGEIKLDKEFNANERYNGTAVLTGGIVLDTTENENAMVDISGLTAVANREEEGLPTVYGITMTRYGALNQDGVKLLAAGKLATGVNDANRGFILISNNGFVLAERDGDLYMDNALIQGIKADGSVTNGAANFAELTVNHKDTALYYIMNGDLENAGELGVSIVLDLNGKTVSGASVAAGKTLQLMDNQNDTYNADNCGKIYVVGDVNPITHIIPVAGNRHYVALVNEDGSWSAHRYLAYTKAISFAPNADAVGFKGGFTGDAVVQQAIVGYGYQMSVNNGNAKLYTMTDAFDTANSTEISLRIKNIMANGGGEMKITGNAVLVFNIDGQTVYADTSAKSTTMKQTIKAVNEQADLTDVQKAAVYNLYSSYKAVMDTWFTAEETNNIATWAPVEEQTPAA